MPTVSLYSRRDGVVSQLVYRPNLRLAIELPQTEAQRRDLITTRLQACRSTRIDFARHGLQDVHPDFVFAAAPA